MKSIFTLLIFLTTLNVWAQRIVTSDLQTDSDDVAYSVALQADGKVVLAGSSDNGSNKNAVLVRYKDDGSLDSTFGNNGVVLTDFENSQQDEIKVVKIHQLRAILLWVEHR
jgi:hypothetical protein